MIPGTTVSLRIDGELVKAEPNQTLFEVAQRCGKFVPGLCQLKGLSPVGACRLCVVELVSVNRMVPSCTTLAQEGMSVVTTSPKLTNYRRMTLELLLAEGNHVCATCVSSGHCELQALAVALGVTHVRYNYSYPHREADLSHPRYVLDHNRCILCTRCVRVCAEVEGAQVWDVMGRGSSSRIIAEMNRKWGDAKGCTSCGKCVQACPTGALAVKGFAVTEMIKETELVTQLTAKRRIRP